MSGLIPVTLPPMGESVSEGMVVRWLKEVGETVAEGEPLVEVTTDKIDVEIPAPAAGTLAEIVAGQDVTVGIGAVLGRIAEDRGVAAQFAEAPVSAKPGSAASEAPPAVTEQRATSLLDARASPLARRAAALLGVDLHNLQPTASGIVRRDDVTRAGESTATPVPPGARITLLKGPAGALVDYMERSLEIPTATSFRTCFASMLYARRRQLVDALPGRGGPKVSFTHIIAYAVGRAAGEMPVMASIFARDGSGRPSRVNTGVNLGLAVDSRRKDGGRFLVVPVIRNADQFQFAEFVAEYERLITKARDNSLTTDELQGATMTLTNPGGVGTVASVPRLMPGQGTIIATGAIGFPLEWSQATDKQRANAGVGRVITMTSTYDHRVIQGAESGEFLGRVEALLNDEVFYSEIFQSLGVAVPPVEAPAATHPVSALTVRATASRDLLAAVHAADSMIKAHRTHGHLAAQLDPLGSSPLGEPAMDPGSLGLTPEVMRQIPADVLGVYVPGADLAEVLPNLRATYSGTIAYEIEHISSYEQRDWLRERIESGSFRKPLTNEQRLVLLRRLSKVEAMERYLRRMFIGAKTFSIEGVDAMVPMLEDLLSVATDDGIQQAVLGMSHRGRLAIIAHVVNQPYEAILAAFEQAERKRGFADSEEILTGDVKYHIGSTGTYLTEHEKEITVRLLPNPSHLEAVDGVVEGWTRAEQTGHLTPVAPRDLSKSMAILIHGDAAFSGQGAVAEVLNLQSLDGYSVGGTVHIIANNQLGFTTDPKDARSTRYASDMAKGFDVPIVHVNADDIEACIHAVRLAYEYRRTYSRDVLIDLVGYRRFGHNEADDPSYTQPVMYRVIRSHPTVREIYALRLVKEGLISDEDVEKLSNDVTARLTEAHANAKAAAQNEDLSEVSSPSGASSETLTTTVDAAKLRELNDSLTAVPEDFYLNVKLKRQWETRRSSLENNIDWGTAEALAFASLLTEGHAIRLVGQDTERGTFSHRHLVLHDEQDGSRWTPMQHIPGARASFEIHNSPLSEVAVLAFEYGYSAAAPGTMVIWEAQFGDFVNNAQMVVDQFIASSAIKWNQRSRLVLLLPHGYEGMGPEHSSARVERLLALAANDNMRIANCSTCAQFFHLLRDQALRETPRPLVVLTPKSLLREKTAGCRLDQLSQGGFQPLIDDPNHDVLSDKARILLFCSGKIYHELNKHQWHSTSGDLAIIRVEMLYPLPFQAMIECISSYPRLEEVYWVQEEPANMGAWPFVQRTLGSHLPHGLTLSFIGRPRLATPAEGYVGSHQVEQERIISAALGPSRTARDPRESPRSRRKNG